MNYPKAKYSLSWPRTTSHTKLVSHALSVLKKKKNILKETSDQLLASVTSDQLLRTHYTSSQNPPLVNHHHHDRGHYMFYPSSLLFLSVDVLALTPPSPNTYPRTYHIPYSRTYSHRGWVPRESTQEKTGCRCPVVVGGQARSKGLPTDPPECAVRWGP